MAVSEQEHTRRLNEVKVISGSTSLPKTQGDLDDFLAAHGDSLSSSHVSSLKRYVRKTQSRAARNSSAAFTKKVESAKPVSWQEATALADKSGSGLPLPEYQRPEEINDLAKELGWVKKRTPKTAINSDTTAHQDLLDAYQHISDVHEYHSDKMSPATDASISSALAKASHHIDEHLRAHMSGLETKSADNIKAAGSYLSTAYDRIMSATNNQAKFATSKTGRTVKDFIGKTVGEYLASDTPGKGIKPKKGWSGPAFSTVNYSSSKSEQADEKKFKDPTGPLTKATIKQRIAEGEPGLADRVIAESPAVKELIANRTRKEWDSVPRYSNPGFEPLPPGHLGPLMPQMSDLVGPKLPEQNTGKLKLPYELPSNYERLSPAQRQKQAWKFEENNKFKLANRAQFAAQNHETFLEYLSKNPIGNVTRDKYGYTDLDHFNAFDEAHAHWFAGYSPNTKRYAARAKTYEKSKAKIAPAAYLDDIANGAVLKSSNKTNSGSEVSKSGPVTIRYQAPGKRA